MGFVRFLFDLAAMIGWVAMIIRVGGRPATRWRHGWPGKIGSLAAIVLLCGFVAGWFVPWGALIVWWRNPGAGDPFELPMADGRRSR